MLNITSIPSARVSIIDERTGLISREWFLFFQNLFNLVGGGRNEFSLEDVQLGPTDQGFALTEIVRTEVNACLSEPAAIVPTQSFEKSSRVLLWLSM